MHLSVPLTFASVAAAAALVPVVASAQVAAPARKAGWWEMTMSMSAPIPMKQKMNFCTDPATEKSNSAFAANQRGNCTQGPVTKTPAGFSFSSVCKEKTMTMTTTGVASGDFQSGYRMESVTKMEPAPMPQMAETKMTIEAKWLGPCPAGKNPGDMVMANGMTMNMNRK